MELRDFLPGEPARGDIVLCVDGGFKPERLARGLELPEKGSLYQVRKIDEEDEDGHKYSQHVRLAGQDTKGDFSRKLEGSFCRSRFKATHLPRSDWSVDTYSHPLDCADPRDQKIKAYSIPTTRRRLWVARRCEAWRELCYSNFGLGLALAVLHPWDDEPPDSHEKLAAAASMRRLEICRQVGFPATSSVLRVLSRLDPSWGESIEGIWLEGNLLTLRHLLTHEPLATDLLLRHEEAISRKHCDNLAFGAGLIGLYELFHDGPEVQRATWLFQLPMARRHWLAAEVEVIERREQFTPCLALLPDRRRIGSFQREKDAVSYLLGRQRLLRHLRSTVRNLVGENGPRSWPEPPLPGSELIQPITSDKDLVEEGKELRHCIATYADKIAIGIYFAYRMPGPTRCTVGVKWTGQRWALDQLRGGANSRIEEEQTEMVHAWIGSHPEHAASLQSNVAKEISRLVRLPQRPRQHLLANARA